MRSIIAVAQCVKKKHKIRGRDWSIFHFKGVLAGERINSISILYDAKIIDIKKGDEYILHLTIIAYNKGVIYGKIDRIKPLETVFF